MFNCSNSDGGEAKMEKQLTIDLNLTVKDLCEYHIKLIGYTKQAHKELKHNIARIFEALSYSKQVQALCILDNMGYWGSTKENLLDLVNDKVNCDMDKFENNATIQELLTRFEEIEEKNKHLFIIAEDSIECEEDLNIGHISVCSKCGYTLVGNAPKECIICNAPSGYFHIY